MSEAVDDDDPLHHDLVEDSQIHNNHDLQQVLRRYFQTLLNNDDNPTHDNQDCHHDHDQIQFVLR